VNVLYEEDGGFKVGAILSEAEASLQVEAAHGKRSKIKATAVALRFEAPPLSAFLAAAESAAAGIELDFLWEVAPEGEFAFADLAREYHGRAPSAVEAAALLLRLSGAPMYFYRKGRGHFRRAPAEALKAALASIERKRVEAQKVEEYAAALARFEVPAAIRAELVHLLYKPERVSVPARALEVASAATGLSAARLLARAGAIRGPYEVIRGRFEFEHFPRGTGFAAHPAPVGPTSLPEAPAPAFSIDDAATTEIDDAFSLRTLPNGRIAVGIHIAAPALGFLPDSDLGAIARARLSTVYMPGAKITMLPDDAVAAFTLGQGRRAPCVSLYVEVEPADMAIAGVATRVESVLIAANLRHHQLDDVVTEAALDTGGAAFPYHAELATLWRFAKRLEAERGRSQAQGFRDFNFQVEWGPDEVAETARVAIAPRLRGAPLDRIVSELMIFANHTWGRLLADRGAAGIYRVKTGVGAAGKVRMTAAPAPHIGLGVSHYAWSSSPLRRYVDLVNQWQLLAVLRGEKPPFAANSEALQGAIAAFDAAYTAYAAFQDSLERYWCLRWLAQEGYAESERTLAATVWRDSARLDALPLSGAVAGMPALAAGTRIAVRVGQVDLWASTVALSYAGLVGGAEATPATPEGVAAGDESGDPD
jgi:exoribonuclease-2